MSTSRAARPVPQETYAERKAREAEQRGDLADAAQWRRIKTAVDLAPPLTDGQRSQLRMLLAPAEPRRLKSA